MSQQQQPQQQQGDSASEDAAADDAKYDEGAPDGHEEQPPKYAHAHRMPPPPPPDPYYHYEPGYAPRGYEGGPPPPYGMPPPSGYGMYPYPPPYYPGYPMYGYPPAPPPPPEYQGYLKDDGEGDEEEKEDIVPGAVTARLKTYIKPRIPTTQDVLDRRARKNAQSRARAAKLRLRVIDIETKSAPERSEEEQQLFRQFENRRQRKNDRSRERALEKKEEIDRILAKPEKKRTKIEKQFLDNALTAKKRKNEGDRMRRQRLKSMGVPAKVGLKGAMARGVHIPPAAAAHHGYHPHHLHHHPYPPPYGGGGGGGGPQMGEIPMSPMPTHHLHMQSPGGFASPGMMLPLPPPGMGYHPSPQHHRWGGPPLGAMETPGRSGPSGGGGSTNMSYMSPSQSYDHTRVEQRRNPDGSMSISIGAENHSGGPAVAEAAAAANHTEEPPAMNISNVAHLLLYDEDGPPNGQQETKDG